MLSVAVLIVVDLTVTLIIVLQHLGQPTLRVIALI